MHTTDSGRAFHCTIASGKKEYFNNKPYVCSFVEKALTVPRYPLYKVYIFRYCHKSIYYFVREA